MNIYVGNLAYSTTESDLRELFAASGEVGSVNIIKDKFSGESKGFGFVDMPNNAQAQAAIRSLNDTTLGGRKLRVNEAKPQESRGPRPNRY